MPNEGSRILVAAFDLSERAERAKSQLLTDGHEPKHVRLLTDPELQLECATEWFSTGLTTEEIGYYADELAAGRWIVAVWSHVSDIVSVLGVFGRHGGSVRLPPEIREGSP